MIMTLKEIGQKVFAAFVDDDSLASGFDFESYGAEIVNSNPQWFETDTEGGIVANAMFLAFVKGE